MVRSSWRRIRLIQLQPSAPSRSPNRSARVRRLPCTVVRDAASAPAAIRDVAATVDFTKFVLVIVERMESPFGPEEHTFDGTVQPAKGGGVLELPAEPCPYCGGAAPPQPRKQQIVVRVPRFDGELRVRSRPSACAPCDPRLP